MVRTIKTRGVILYKLEMITYHYTENKKSSKYIVITVNQW